MAMLSISMRQEATVMNAMLKRVSWEEKTKHDEGSVKEKKQTGRQGVRRAGGVDRTWGDIGVVCASRAYSRLPAALAPAMAIESRREKSPVGTIGDRQVWRNVCTCRASTILQSHERRAYAALQKMCGAV
jgi:hypothetical protein